VAGTESANAQKDNQQQMDLRLWLELCHAMPRAGRKTKRKKED